MYLWTLATSCGAQGQIRSCVTFQLNEALMRDPTEPGTRRVAVGESGWTAKTGPPQAAQAARGRGKDWIRADCLAFQPPSPTETSSVGSLLYYFILLKCYK
jgi:hypothetical protein